MFVWKCNTLKFLLSPEFPNCPALSISKSYLYCSLSGSRFLVSSLLPSNPAWFRLCWFQAQSFQFFPSNSSNSHFRWILCCKTLFYGPWWSYLGKSCTSVICELYTALVSTSVGPVNLLGKSFHLSLVNFLYHFPEAIPYFYHFPESPCFSQDLHGLASYKTERKEKPLSCMNASSFPVHPWNYVFLLPSCPRGRWMFPTALEWTITPTLLHLFRTGGQQPSL